MSLGVVIGIVIRIGGDLFLGAGGIDDDSGLAIDRALVLADPAARAFLFFDDRTFLLVTDDGLIGALFITHEADLIRIPGDASGLIDVGHSHLNQPLLFKGNGPDRLGGTNPSAEVAELLAVPYARHKPGCIKTRQSCFQEGRLEGVIGADLEALPASGTGGDKALFR